MKRMWALALSLIIISTLVACGKDAQKADPTQQTATQETGIRKPASQGAQKPDVQTDPAPTRATEHTKPVQTQPTVTEPEPTEPDPIDPQLYQQAAGTYLIYQVTDPQLKLDYEQLCQMGQTDGYVRLEADGTGVEQLGDETAAFTYDLATSTLTRDDGTLSAIKLSGEMITVYMGDTQVSYVREGSPLLEYDPEMGTYWLYGMSFGESYADHDAICQAGLEQVHVVLYSDGSGAMVLADQQKIVFTYDLESQTMTDGTGVTDGLRLEGQTLTITDRETGEEMIFRQEDDRR